MVEMAAAAGLPLAGDKKDPCKTTTYGVGQLVRHAVERGARRIILGLGGSCTNDGGCGCAAALGVKFTDQNGREFVPVGGTLDQIAGIDVAAARELLRGVEVTAMCDIDNPMYGRRGAAYIFAPQKGADDGMVKFLDGQLRALDRAIGKDLGLHVADLPGAGAAGGFGAGCVAFLGARLKSGIETVLDTVDFDGRVAGADVVFTGEGRIDSQSVHGKVIDGVSRRASRAGVPLVAIVGDVGDDGYGAYDAGVTAIFSINRLAIPFSEAWRRSRQDYARTYTYIYCGPSLRQNPPVPHGQRPLFAHVFSPRFSPLRHGMQKNNAEKGGQTFSAFNVLSHTLEKIPKKYLTNSGASCMITRLASGMPCPGSGGSVAMMREIAREAR